MHTQLQNRPRVAIDTNMLAAIKGLKVDIFSELENMFGGNAEFLVPKQVLEELEAMKEKGETMKSTAAIALEETKRHNVNFLEVKSGNADQALEKMAKEGCFVATNDAALRKRIKGFGGKVIYLRQGRFLKKG